MNAFAADAPHRIAVVIPSYKVRRHILAVIAAIGPEVERVYVVDDRCPDASGDFVEQHCRDPRVRVLRHELNQGVGGAVMTGYAAAVAEGYTIAVKIDGDGQMDPRLLPLFVRPILEGRADYTKGNRFYDLAQIQRMPALRLIGNAGLSFLSKLSTGYWHLFDPTNGYTAIDTRVAAHLPTERISRRYFFETDLLFRLNIARAAVVDVPMDAVYADEESNLKIGKIFGEFLVKHVRNFVKRIFYNYFLRDMSAASLELAFGAALMAFGLGFGAWKWLSSAQAGIATPAGSVMLAALPVIVGLQFVLAFIAFDVASVPARPIAPYLPDPARPRAGTGTPQDGAAQHTSPQDASA
ncbi:glycosyl transferase family 2 [Lysobacter enzymogenes]|uniref:glycosyltransferase family 2 protein n=1 Tax=Lysobacter enzymogenes TaxID=69 RepID=UPI0019D30466|nr:glycosyltransferase family 2 protein [Lysobacter enzymogenes]MBN7138445.1 glycosyl transferase family 2 [Lysobacter enzymogenes]